MIINCDETGLSIVPTSEYTYEKLGSKQVTMHGKSDKRQITMVASISFSGDVLPPQIIYKGKTDRSHPKEVNFNESWLIDNSESHWTTFNTFNRFIEKLLIPYIHKQRQTIGDKPGLLILDKFKVHLDGTAYKEMLKAHNIFWVFVPSSQTDSVRIFIISIYNLF